PIIRGTVRYSGKVPKHPVEIISLRDSAIAVINTNVDGSFHLTTNNSLTVEGRKLFLSVNTKINDGYTIKIENPFFAINESQATKIEIPVLGLASRVQKSKDFELKGMKSAISLNQVTIKVTRGDNSIYSFSNECGDYVCIYNILNCPRHYSAPGNRGPVKGETYVNWRTVVNGKRIPSIYYTGCTGDINRGTLIGESIYAAREFYGVNMDDDGLLETQFLSTLMWQPGLVVNDGGEIRTSFATSDITGKFRLVVQGIGTQNLIFGENIFTVE
ncbi:MAG: hypothetical protein ACO1N7_08795, partial [Sphingobacteriaceae bacterium]